MNAYAPSRTILKNIGSLALSLILAVLVWVTAIREQNPPQEGNFNRPIPIEINAPAANLVTTDILPSTVLLRIRTPQDRWPRLSPANFKAVLDLSELPVGLHEVPIQVAVDDKLVEIIAQEPNQVTVNIQAQQTITIPVQVELLDQPSLGYINQAPTTLPKEVEVVGPASLVSQAAEAVVSLSLEGARETIQQYRPIEIRDRDGETLKSLHLTPTEVEVAVSVEQRFDYRDVSVRAVVEGQVSPGYWVSNITVSPPTITIFGNPRVLNAIPGYVETVPVNLNQTTEDIERVVPLNLPDGIMVVSAEDGQSRLTGVTVQVDITAIESGKTIRQRVTQQGINPEFNWIASPLEVDVIISGPIPRLQTLTPDDIAVIVNLFELEPGIHSVEPQVFLPDDLTVSAVLPQIIEVTISPNPQPATRIIKGDK